MTEDERQALLDEEHLRLLALGYQISGWVLALFALFPLIYVAFGVLVVGMARLPGNKAEPGADVVGWFLVAIGLVISLVMGALAAVKVAAGRYLRRRTARNFCMVVAGISCLGIPWGTLLGVATLLVLARPSVRLLFESVPVSTPPQADSGVA